MSEPRPLCSKMDHMVDTIKEVQKSNFGRYGHMKNRDGESQKRKSEKRRDRKKSKRKSKEIRSKKTKIGKNASTPKGKRVAKHWVFQ